MVTTQQYVEQEVISTEDLAEEVVEETDVFQEAEEILPDNIKVEDCVGDTDIAVNGIVEEESPQETFLCENIFANADMTKAFEDEDVFVNEVTIEEVKEEPIDVAQE